MFLLKAYFGDKDLALLKYKIMDELMTGMLQLYSIHFHNRLTSNNLTLRY